MAEIEFDTIEAGIVTRIKDECDYLRTVESYAGQVDQVSEGRAIEAPAAFVRMNQVIPQEAGEMMDGGYVAAVQFTVIVAAISYKSREEARTDDAIGAYRICKDIVTALNGDDLDITGFQGLTYMGTTFVTATETRVLYQVDFKAMVEVE